MAVVRAARACSPRPSWHTACRGRGGSGPAAGAYRVPLPALAPHGTAPRSRDLRRVGLGMDSAKMVSATASFPRSRAAGPGRAPGARAARPRRRGPPGTDRAELRNIAGLVLRRTDAATFPERLLQERAPLGKAARERTRIAKGGGDRSSHSRLSAARQRARPRSNTRMAASRSPWARYRWPRRHGQHRFAPRPSVWRGGVPPPRGTGLQRTARVGSRCTPATPEKGSGQGWRPEPGSSSRHGLPE